MIKQKEAVYLAVCAIRGVTQFSQAVKLDKDERSAITESIFADFKTGKIQCDKSELLADEKELKSYVSGLVSNWLRKDKRLNGNTTYVPANPGSRAGSGDEQIQAMKALLSTVTDPANRKEIEEAIAARQTALKPKKEINVEALPESLRHLAPNRLQ